MMGFMINSKAKKENFLKVFFTLKAPSEFFLNVDFSHWGQIALFIRF